MCDGTPMFILIQNAASSRSVVRVGNHCNPVFKLGKNKSNNNQERKTAPLNVCSTRRHVLGAWSQRVTFSQWVSLWFMQRGRWASDASRLKCTRARDSCLRATLPDTPRNQPSPTSPSGPRWSRDTTWPGWGVSRSGWGPGDLSIRSPSFPVSPPTMHAWEEDRRRIFYLDTHSFKGGGWGGEQICWQLPCRDADVMTFVVARYVHATWLLASIPYFHFPVVLARSVGFLVVMSSERLATFARPLGCASSKIALTCKVGAMTGETVPILRAM